MITHSPNASHQVQLELQLAHPAAYHHTKRFNFNSALCGGYGGYKSKVLYENKIHLNVYLKMMF